MNDSWKNWLIGISTSLILGLFGTITTLNYKAMMEFSSSVGGLQVAVKSLSTVLANSSASAQREIGTLRRRVEIMERNKKP